MIKIRVNRLGCAALLLLAGIAATSAQERVVGPLPSLAPLIEDVAPAVANISVQGTIEFDMPIDPLFEPFLRNLPRERQLRGEGSGVIVDAAEGYLLTNHHVVENADEILVRLADGRRFQATVVGSDADSDLAVLKIDGDDLTAVPVATEDDLRVGDYVVAIGNPLGLENTVTAGIVSALGRNQIGDADPTRVYQDFIQTDASINVGNSGGALVNLRGELVGINSAIISQTGGNIGIGLAIPVRMAIPVMEQLIEYGEVRRGYLGIGMDQVTPDVAQSLGLSVSSGAQVTQVMEDSAAESAGIRINDVIVGVNGNPITTPNELRNGVGILRPGSEVTLDIVRDSGPVTITAVLGARPDDGQPVTQEEARPPDPIFEGVELAEYRRNGVAALAVTAVDPNSLAAARGLQEGDLIIAINRQRVSTLAEARVLVASSQFIQLQIRRGNRDRLLRLR